MADGVVLRKHYDNIGKPNVVCRVDKFCYLVKKLDPKRRELVESMGFGGLLHLDMKNIPRQFYYWLMSRVFGDGTVVFGDGSILPLGPNQVRSILGIPMGRKEVPLVLGDDEDDTQKIMRVFQQYGVGLKRETVSLNLAAAAMCPEHEDGTLVELETEFDEEDFMIAFPIVALGMIVYTTTNSSNLVASLVPTLVVASVAGEYDWCKFTIDWVRESADRFQTKFQKDGFRYGCGGSFVFLMIFYLDHLHRVPNRWGVYPRLKVWDSDHLKAVIDEDRRSDEEFGFFPVLDIAYGEDHPLVPRNDGDLELVHIKVANTSVNSIADQVLALLTHRLVSLVEGIVGKALGSSSKAGHLDMHTVSMGKGSQPHLSGSSNKGAKVLKAPQEKCPAEEKESCNSSNGEIADTMTRETAYDKRLETFVKGWKDLKDEKKYFFFCLSFLLSSGLC
ncbi:uncharacterized protein LOC110735538 isoform X2 [Chenopodium quinoa]|uniref:uncharacterized protein LOC110735538 isoform X2 n=1 Tax=Chenopodium quinoa TaxID=63459 RepID=UPI000B773D39|nr:uncharacterized protein LOC110735538 isoform X2 [Chenopodium quinoa]